MFDSMQEEAEFVNPNAIPRPDGSGTMNMVAVEAEHARLQPEYADACIRAEATRRGIAISAAADLMGPGVLEVPLFEKQIMDYTRGRGVLGQRARRVRATGQPTRWFEQRTTIDGTFVDPRQFSVAPVAHRRAERSAVVKCIGSGINLSMFDAEVTRDQALHSDQLADDVERTVKGVLRCSDKAFWRGTDTSLVEPSSLQYCGGFNQINRNFLVPSNASAIDAIKTEFASMVANEDFEVKPSAIYANPMTIDIIDQEERQNHRQLATVGVVDKDGRVIAGVTVAALQTAAGLIPLIPDWSIPAPVTPSVTEGAGHTDYKLVIVTEELVEVRYVGSPVPRLFVLGLTGNLATQYVCVLYDCVIFKGKADVANTPETNAISYPHSIGTIVR